MQAMYSKKKAVVELSWPQQNVVSFLWMMFAITQVFLSIKLVGEVGWIT